jgi:signal transduction histidine kinase
MASGPVDPRWPRVLSLAVHEFRTPLTVVAGYIRMLLKDRAGPLSDQQRRLLEEAEKSCGRLSALVAEMSDLSQLEAGTATFNRARIDLRSLLADVIAGLPAMPDHDVTIELATAEAPAAVQGDPVRLKTAFSSLLAAVRRELVTSTRLLVRQAPREYNGSPASWIAIADEEHIAALETAQPDAFALFDEWRGGVGLSLTVARRIIAAHGGAVWSAPGDDKAAAVVVLPHG